LIATKKNQGWLLREPAFLSVNRQQKWFCHFDKFSDQRDTYKIKEKESKVRANVSEKIKSQILVTCKI